MAVIGSIMPWATISSVFGTINKSGTEGDGIITLIIGIIVILCGAIALAIEKNDVVLVLSTLGSIGIIGIAILDIVDTSRRVAEISGEYVKATVGGGLYITLVSGVIVLVGLIIVASGHSLARKPAKYLCPNCDEPVREGDRFCRRCGSEFQW